MKIHDLVAKQKGKLITCRDRDTAQTAAALMTSNKIGALPVLDDDGKLVGVISERDVMRSFAAKGREAVTSSVADLMTRDVTVCKPDDSVKEAMLAMGRIHVRHLPVVDKEALVGMISQRDVLARILQETQLEVGVLRDYARAKP